MKLSMPCLGTLSTPTNVSKYLKPRPHAQVLTELLQAFAQVRLRLWKVIISDLATAFRGRLTAIEELTAAVNESRLLFLSLMS
jgi:hypothetical protein